MKNVVVAQFWHLDLGHEIGRGVIDFASSGVSWRITKLELEIVKNHLDDWVFDALILPGVFDMARMAHLLSKQTLIVSTHSNPAMTAFPQIDLDHLATGKLAAQYFMDRGYRHFLGINRTPTSAHEMRLTGFLDTLQKHGHKPVAIHHDDPHVDPTLAQWIKITPKPVAVFCSTDRQACTIIEMAQLAGFSVPNDIAVMGCEDESSICLCAPVHISSIRLPHFQVGYEAGRLMDLLLQGKAPPTQLLSLPPDCVIERASTAATISAPKQKKPAKK